MAALPPLNALRAFEAAARRGSFAAAAGELNVTPAAIGQQVRQLEALIGSALFEREGRTLRLTERGGAALDRLSRAFELMGEASAAMRESKRAARIILALPFDMASLWLAPRLAARSSAPGLEIITRDPLTALDEGADLAIIRSADTPTGQDSQLLLRETLSPLAAPALARQIRTPADLETLPLIADTSIPLGWTEWLARRGAYGIAVQPAFITDGTGPAMALAEAGAGLVLGRKLLVASAVNEGRLVSVFADGDMPDGENYWLAFARGRRRSDAVNLFAAWFRAEIAGAVDAADEL
ncbi:LysR family transcriptional regulator [Glycocaulis alkaliphilus]|uniref:LysR family transcriptional regulator n=1 Tax=Glycocaulis alkaliphilus TaxID=1434191 RepID=A0A3T0EAV9_9PROT|nr:LysR substrate-binding domain-containing protein [Glycocaulis alkaliphilus]AZU04432.1 LysR family transcriptional regulator [Glycocaulis alkaliphilus]GGB78338.1 LysR family transcriptional regulator [Glycocaulis alkaliphilus]